MTTRIESGLKKIRNRMLVEAKRWASNLGVKHRRMDLDELKENFEKDGYSFGFFEKHGAEIDIWLIDAKSKKTLYEGTVKLYSSERKDDVEYEGN